MSARNECCWTNSAVSSNCSSCFYGPLCQFTTAYYNVLSLQTIWCSIKSIPIALILHIFVIASILNVLAIGTFCQSSTREMGNGIYRLWISIVGQVGLTIVGIHLYLENSNTGDTIGCYIFEYLREVIHALYDSLTACTMLERTMVVYQGIAFNKMRSRRIAKMLIPILVFYHFLSSLYEPFYRQIQYTMNQSWCILKFPNRFVLNYASTISLVHFIVPYLINLTSSVFWIILLTKHKSMLNKNVSVWINFKNVIYSYKSTIISFYTLILLNTPRFVSVFYFNCIQLQWQNTFYITSYCLSFIPLMTNLFIFVLPSPKYRPALFGFVQRIMAHRQRSQYNLT